MIGTYAPIGFLLVLMLFPFYWMLITSLKTNPELYNAQANPFWVVKPTLDHYARLLGRTQFLNWAANTMVISIVSTLISLTCAVMSGYALARLRFRGAGFLGTAIFVTYLVPNALLFIPMAEIMRSLGLLNNLLALIITYPTFLIPFATWLLMAYFKTIPKEIEECALIDGASRLQTIWKIVLPLATPGVLSAGIFAFTLSWNEFLYALIFMTSSELKTVPVGVVGELIRADAYFWGALMAGALLGSVPVAFVYSFFVESYVSGLTAGAVKG
ncbi:MAG: carbohydrate ABC transporter permease [Chloroflexi bacterium]|nr:carbohydrate ABC transporter permease [Chloroflexota bacterium]